MAQHVHNKRSRYIRITTNALQTYLLHNSPNATLTLVQQTSISLFQSFLILPFDITHFTFLGDKSIESISNPSATLRIYTYSQPDTGFIHAVENIHHTGSTILPLHLQQHYHCTNDCAKVHTGIVASNNSRPE